MTDKQRDADLALIETGPRQQGVTAELIRSLAQAADEALGPAVFLVPRDTPIPPDLPPNVRVLPYAPDGRAYRVNVGELDGWMRRLFLRDLDAARAPRNPEGGE